MNEALNLNRRSDIMDEVALMFEAFTDDVLDAISCNDFIIQYNVDSKRENCIVVTWDWNRINKHNEKEFSLQVVDTADDFVNAIKSYLFDLTVTLINL